MDDDFANTIIPYVLQNTTGMYRVKGGRAHNAYFISEHSRDWDVECTAETAAEIIDKITTEAEKFGNRITVEHRETFNSYHLTLDDESEPLIDLLVVPFYGVSVYKIDDVRYITLFDHVIDSLITCNNRFNIFSNFRLTLRHNIENINKRLRNILKNDQTDSKLVQLTLDQDPHLTIVEIQNAVISRLSELSDSSDIYIEKFKEIGEGPSVQVFSELFAEKLDPESYKMWMDTQLPILEEYDRLVHSAILADEYYQMYRKALAKYEKSRRRLTNIEDITWDSLTPTFQGTLMYCVGYQYLFTLYDMNYFLNCINKEIVLAPL